MFSVVRALMVGISLSAFMPIFAGKLGEKEDAYAQGKECARLLVEEFFWRAQKKDDDADAFHKQLKPFKKYFASFDQNFVQGQVAYLKSISIKDKALSMKLDKPAAAQYAALYYFLLASLEKSSEMKS